MKEKIHAVSDSGLARLLESLGLVESIEKGLLFCSCCGKRYLKRMLDAYIL